MSVKLYGKTSRRRPGFILRLVSRGDFRDLQTITDESLKQDNWSEKVLKSKDLDAVTLACSIQTTVKEIFAKFTKIHICDGHTS